MKFKLPLIGEVRLGKDVLPAQVIKEVVKETKEKATLGGFIDLFKDSSLVTETTASNKLIQANMGWVYKNNDVIAKEVANIEFELFTVRVVGKEVVFTPILQHPILDALDRFNEFTAASDGFYLTQSHRKLAGDSFWYIDGRKEKIKGIYLLQPDKVKLEFGKEAPGQNVISKYVFETTVNAKPIKEEYDPEEIIHFKIPNPSNPYRGKSAVEAAAETIDLDNYGTEAIKGLFKRGMINNVVFSTDNRLTPDQIEELRAQINNNYSGVSNAYKAMILSGGLKPEALNMSSKDAEFNLLQTWNRDKIMSIFGNNRAVLGITDDVNRSNAESTILNWKRTTVKSEMKGITDTLNEFFVPRFGTNLLLSFKDPVPEDRRSKVDEIKILRETKVITQNEARDWIGLDPAKEEGADQLNQPMPEINPQEVPKSVLNVNYKSALRRMGIYKTQQKVQELSEAFKPVAKRIIDQRRAKDAEMREHASFTNDAVWKFHTQQIRVVISQEEVFAVKVERFINGLVARAVDQIPTEVARMQRKALLQEADEMTRAVIDFAPVLNEVAILAGQQALSFIGDDNHYIPVDIRKVVEKEVRKFAESMIETDKNKIIDMIADGLSEGHSVPKIRQNILTEFEEFSKMQAERITRTEVIRASNYGTIDAWANSSLVVGKQWLTAKDDRVDPLCASMNGKIIYGVNKNFFNKGESLEVDDQVAKFDYGAIKAPPLHPNCRCTLLPVLKGQNFVEYSPSSKELEQKIKDLESKLDKRTKEFRQLKSENLDDKAYIKALELLNNE